MKRTELAATLILALLLLVATEVLAIKEVKANPAGMSRMFWTDKIVVQSPQNKTYNAETLPINFTVELLPDNPPIYTRCVLSNLRSGRNVTVDVTGQRTNASNEYQYYTSVFSQYNSSLPNLADGTYILTVQRYHVKPMEPEGIKVRIYASVFFTIDTIPPDISVLMLENRTYDTPDVPLSFTVNELASQITYNLDEQENVTITGNTTLTGLSGGSHTLTVYAKDVAGNIGISETITFSIQEPFLTTLAVTLLASAAAIGSGLLVYFTKIRKTPGKPKNNKFSTDYIATVFWKQATAIILGV